MQDVADRANVSVATVSYTLSGAEGSGARVGEATRARVLDAVRELGYVPHQSAQNLRRQSTNRICLSVPRLSVPYYDALARELQLAGESKGLHLIVTVDRTIRGASSVVRHMQGGLADAFVIVMEQRIEDAVAEQLERAAEMGIATVLIGHCDPPRKFDVVSEGDDEACFEAVTYLIERGHRRIGCVALELERGKRHHRYASYKRALAHAGIDLDEDLVRDGGGDRLAALAAARELFGLADPPTALFACTDVAALSAIRAARDLGLRVPDDVAVVGAGDIAEGELVDPPLTTVGPQRREFHDVTELVLERLGAREPMPGRSITKRWELKVRGSA